MECSRYLQIFLLTVVALFLVIWLQGQQFLDRGRRFCGVTRDADAVVDSADAYFSAAWNPTGEIIDYRRCPPLESLRIFVHDFDHPLAKALASHPSATKNAQQACLFFSFVDADVQELRIGDPNVYPPTWNATGIPGGNHVVINVKSLLSLAPAGREMLVQASFDNGNFRPLLDFELFPDVENFDIDAWIDRPSIIQFKRKVNLSLVVDEFHPKYSTPFPKIECEDDCFHSLISTSFCLLPPSPLFQSRLLSALRAGCIPIVLSSSQFLPFQDQLDWRLASFRFPRSMIDFVPAKLNELTREDVTKMRIRGRIILAMIDDAQALSKSLLSAISDRIQIELPL